MANQISPVIARPSEVLHLNPALIQSLLLRTRIGDMHGLPYPIHFRNLDVLKDWQKLFAQHPTSQTLWSRGARPDGSVIDSILICKELIVGLQRSKNPVSVQQWEGMSSMPAVHMAVNLTYQQRQGVLIEATPALEVLLTQSDVDPDFPLDMVMPPYSAQYLRFGAHAAQTLPSPTGRADQHIDGVFCFSSPVVLPDGTTTVEREFSLAFILKTKNVFSECLTFSTQLEDEKYTLRTWLEHMLTQGDNYGHGHKDQDKTIQAISYVAKVFLYMSLKETRRVAINATSQLASGQPKLGKRRQGFLYDRIQVGPESLPQWDATDPSGLAVSPHWRRGHFRMQTHGPQSSLRKVMFIMPTIVRADRLEGEAPAPKSYRAR